MLPPSVYRTTSSGVCLPRDTTSVLKQITVARCLSAKIVFRCISSRSETNSPLRLLLSTGCHPAPSASYWLPHSAPPPPQYLLHGSGYYLKRLLSLSLSKKKSCFLMEPECSLPPSQKSARWILSWASWIQFAPNFLFPLLRSCQRISPGPRRFETFRNNDNFLRWGVVRPAPNPQAGRPSLVGCPRLLFQYIRSYPPYPEDFPPSATWWRAMPWWQGTHVTCPPPILHTYTHALFSDVIHFTLKTEKARFFETVRYPTTATYGVTIRNNSTQIFMTLKTAASHATCSVHWSKFHVWSDRTIVTGFY
jgi:hypothetical protein